MTLTLETFLPVINIDIDLYLFSLLQTFLEISLDNKTPFENFPCNPTEKRKIINANKLRKPLVT